VTVIFSPVVAWGAWAPIVTADSPRAIVAAASHLSFIEHTSAGVNCNPVASRPGWYDTRRFFEKLYERRDGLLVGRAEYPQNLPVFDLRPN
jgi:hypothetical protein